MRYLEHTTQVSFMCWIKYNQHRHPAMPWIHATPNAAKRNPRLAYEMKAEGLIAGVWDVFVPWMTKDKGGLWIEHKAGKNKLTTEQESFRMALILNYEFVVSYDWITSARAVYDYLKLSGERP